MNYNDKSTEYLDHHENLPNDKTSYLIYFLTFIYSIKC